MRDEASAWPHGRAMSLPARPRMPAPDFAAAPGIAPGGASRTTLPSPQPRYLGACGSMHA